MGAMCSNTNNVFLFPLLSIGGGEWWSVQVSESLLDAIMINQTSNHIAFYSPKTPSVFQQF